MVQILNTDPRCLDTAAVNPLSLCITAALVYTCIAFHLHTIAVDHYEHETPHVTSFSKHYKLMRAHDAAITEVFVRTRARGLPLHHEAGRTRANTRALQVFICG